MFWGRINHFSNIFIFLEISLKFMKINVQIILNFGKKICIYLSIFPHSIRKIGSKYFFFQFFFIIILRNFIENFEGIFFFSNFFLKNFSIYFFFIFSTLVCSKLTVQKLQIIFKGKKRIFKKDLSKNSY